MPDLSRRQILAGAAATAAVAAVPAAAIAKIVEPATSLTITFPAWEPGALYSVGSIVRMGTTLHYCMRLHVSGSSPGDEMTEVAGFR